MLPNTQIRRIPKSLITPSTSTSSIQFHGAIVWNWLAASYNSRHRSSGTGGASGAFFRPIRWGSISQRLSMTSTFEALRQKFKGSWQTQQNSPRAAAWSLADEAVKWRGRARVSRPVLLLPKQMVEFSLMQCRGGFEALWFNVA